MVRQRSLKPPTQGSIPSPGTERPLGRLSLENLEGRDARGWFSAVRAVSPVRQETPGEDRVVLPHIHGVSVLVLIRGC